MRDLASVEHENVEGRSALSELGLSRAPHALQPTRE